MSEYSKTNNCGNELEILLGSELNVGKILHICSPSVEQNTTGKSLSTDVTLMLGIYRGT